MVFGKGIGQPGTQGIGCIAPQVFAVIGTIHFFFKIKRFSRNILLAVGQPHQDMRQRQADVARIFRFAKRAPFDVFGALKNLGHVARSCCDAVDELLDEQPLVALTREVLENLGYTVVTAADGQEGIDLFSLRKDEIVESIHLPEHLAAEHTLREQYVSYKDVSKMILKRYTGWWNDLPSQWSPAPMPAQARMIIDMAGGVDAVLAKTREILPRDVGMVDQDPGQPDPKGGLDGLPYKQAKEKTLEQFNQTFIGDLLTIHGGNVTQAARQCGLERQALQQIMRRYRIHADDYR